MNWNSRDMKSFCESKEYIDTAIIPLLPFSLQEDMGQAISMTEYINLLTLQLERRFKGRLLLLPGYTYFRNTLEERLIEEVNQRVEELQREDFKHILLTTSDANWRTRDERLKGTLIWLPSIPLNRLKDIEKLAVLDDQVKQLAGLLFQNWQQA